MDENWNWVQISRKRPLEDNIKANTQWPSLMDYIYTYIYIHTHTNTHTFVFVFVCVYIYIHTHTFVFVFVCVCVSVAPGLIQGQTIKLSGSAVSAIAVYVIRKGKVNQNLNRTIHVSLCSVLLMLS